MLTYAYFLSLLGAIGYGCIIFEHKLRVDKASLALITGIMTWIVYLVFGPEATALKLHKLHGNLGEISQVILYLIGAMLIVEVVENHKGFEYVAKKIRFRSTGVAFATILLIAFFVSSVLDNLTTVIIMITFLKKVIPDRSQRIMISTACVFAVNAGGAWTPIGDITTTMLWIENKITTFSIMKNLFIPSITSLGIFGFLVYTVGKLKDLKIDFIEEKLERSSLPKGAFRVMAVGLGSLLAVPILKATIDLPPFMGILLGVSILWIMTDVLHKGSEERQTLKVFHSLGRIDFSCVLFFLGVLLTVDVLEASNVFVVVSRTLEEAFPSQVIVTYMVGLISAVVDNVPLVGAMVKMYDPATYPTDDKVWSLTAYAAGVGGSLFSIGSAPGIALMSLEKVDFKWFAKHFFLVSLIAFTIAFGMALYFV